MSIVDSRTSTTMRAGFWKRFDADGTVWMQAYISAALDAKTPYAIQVDEFGTFAEALPAAGQRCWIGVPDHAMSTGDVDWLQIGGYCSGVITANVDSGGVGFAFTIDTGAVNVTGADFTGAASEFAAATVDSTGAATTHYMMLVPERVTTV